VTGHGEEFHGCRIHVGREVHWNNIEHLGHRVDVTGHDEEFHDRTLHFGKIDQHRNMKRLRKPLDVTGRGEEFHDGSMVVHCGREGEYQSR